MKALLGEDQFPDVSSRFSVAGYFTETGFSGEDSKLHEGNLNV